MSEIEHIGNILDRVFADLEERIMKPRTCIQVYLSDSELETIEESAGKITRDLVMRVCIAEAIRTHPDLYEEYQNA